MILRQLPGIFLSACIPLFLCSAAIAQFSFNANSEFGYYKNSGSGIFRKNDFTTRLDLNGKYEYEVDENYFSASAGIKPELYGFKDNLKGIKFSGKGSYYDNSDALMWGINFSAQKNIFKAEGVDINTDLVFLTSDFYFDLSDSFPLHLMVGYAYQKYNYSVKKNFDILFLDCRYEENLFDDIGFYSGLFSERFVISNKSNLSYSNFSDKNKGWRLGPQIGINYLQSFLLKCEYRILFHFSDITKEPSFEQNYKVLAGTHLYKNLSAFLLVDFYIRNFNLKKDFSQVRYIIYSPMNSENRFYLKLLYDIDEKFGLYTRYGYRKEILDYFDSYLEGWSLVLGIEFNY